jgi:hypothetical protein
MRTMPEDGHLIELFCLYIYYNIIYVIQLIN